MSAEAPPAADPRRVTLLAGLSLAVWVALLYGDLVDGWWFRDDARMLASACKLSPWQYFCSPTAWREISSGNLTPFLLLAFDIDKALFGLDPAGYYARYLFELWLLLLASFVLLRRWAGAGWALVATLMFATTSPAATELHGLFRRHYVEGLLFSVVALLLFLRALRCRRAGWAWLGALAYFVAIGNKELYVPLVLVLPLLPVADWRSRWRCTLPFGLVAALYVVWRRVMLGDTVGGYGGEIGLSEVASIPVLAARSLFGGDALGAAAGLVAAALVVSLMLRRPAARLLVPLIAACVLSPLVFVLPLGTPKLLLLVVWVWLAAAVCELASLHGRGGGSRIAALACALLLGLACYRTGARSSAFQAADSAPYEAQGRFLMRAEADAVLLADIGINEDFSRSLLWLKQHVLGEAPPGYVMDELQLDGATLAGKRFFEYEQDALSVAEVTAGMPERLAAWRRRIKQRPLSVEMIVRDGTVHWTLGPWRPGGYRMLEQGAFGTRSFPRTGQGRMAISDTLVFRIRYDSSPKGWITYSDLLEFHIVEGEHLVWERTASADGSADPSSDPR